jgi:hypothetical protein
MSVRRQALLAYSKYALNNPRSVAGIVANMSGRING